MHMSAFVMPKLGADMTQGRLVQWCKNPGDQINRGDVIAVIETDKTNIDVESFQTGVLEKILVTPGDAWLPVGTPLAMLREAGEAEAEQEVERQIITGPAPTLIPAPAPRAATITSADTERVRISPAARKLAEEHHVDITSLSGSGPGGRITLEDIQAIVALAKTTVTKQPPLSEDKQARMREAIGSAMARSKREIPHYYLRHDIDLTHALQWMADTNAKRPVTNRLLYGVLLVKAVALALREAPEFNAWYVDGRASARSGIHVGVAIVLRGGGLVAPALLDADKLSLDKLMQNFQDLVLRARAGSLRSSEYSEPTITVTSLGERGVDTVYGVIFPPQVAMVGFGAPRLRACVVNDIIAPRKIIDCSLSADHRISDGHRGALFLLAIERLLQEPEKL
jgi:pyruvate dehydrogenase E2 component (dihydrolipoamide acetyltransferase)